MTAVTLDLEDVRAELHVDDVVQKYGLRVRNRGSQYRLTECPCCKDSSSSEAIAIDKRSGRWCHHGRERDAGGECSGTLLDLVAVCEGLNPKRDFAKVLDIAAKIAGVDARQLTEAERAERRRYREQQALERQRQADAEEAAVFRESVLKASSTWLRTGRVRETRTMRAYLRSRGLDATRIVEEDHARSDLAGNVCVPLWDLGDSEILNVISRIVSETNTGPKAKSLTGCSTSGTLCGRVADITKGASVIVTEGVIDTLTAIQRWPGRVVLGANGTGRMTRIVETVAPIVLEMKGKLVLVPHTDEPGQKAAIKAGEAAIAAGLVLHSTLIVIDVAPHKDLNEAHCAGWEL
ncbi:MAG: toprim domain-containing protein [Kofleriaceae bacterium]|nr:toprim domain-containing protein [Kofleriaceae bacterium]